MPTVTMRRVFALAGAAVALGFAPPSTRLAAVPALSAVSGDRARAAVAEDRAVASRLRGWLSRALRPAGAPAGDGAPADDVAALRRELGFREDAVRELGARVRALEAQVWELEDARGGDGAAAARASAAPREEPGDDAAGAGVLLSLIHI